MKLKEKLLKEIDQIPEPLLSQLLDFTLFIKARYVEDDISEEEEGRLSFVLEANETLENGVIAVDADVDDPLIDNGVEFDIDQPEFITEDSVEIQVIG